MSEMMKVIKVDYCGRIKRTHNIPAQLINLQQYITDTYPKLLSTPFEITYKDQDNDTITLFNHIDLQEAYIQLKEANKDTIKFFVGRTGDRRYVEESKILRQ